MQDLHLKLSDWLLLLPLSLFVYLIGMPGPVHLSLDAPALMVVLFSLHRAKGLPLSCAFGVGLIQDIFSLAPLGQHAIGLVVLAYLTQVFRDRFRILDPVRQLPPLFCALLLVKFIHGWVAALGFGQFPAGSSFLSVLVTGVLWVPLAHMSFRLLRRRRLHQKGIS